MTLTFKGEFDFSKVKKATHPAAVRGLTMAMEHVLQVSRELVPNEEGTLERSGRVVVDEAALTGAVTYGDGGAEDYAVVQHENLEYHHPGGRQAKYLEQPMREEARVCAEMVAAQIRRALR